MEEMLDLAAERLALCRRNTEHWFGEIALHRDQTLAVLAEAFAQLLEPVQRALAHEAVDVALARQQVREQMPADETGRASYEIGHGLFPLGLVMRRKIAKPHAR